MGHGHDVRRGAARARLHVVLAAPRRGGMVPRSRSRNRECRNLSRRPPGTRSRRSSSSPATSSARPSSRRRLPGDARRGILWIARLGRVAAISPGSGRGRRPVSAAFSSFRGDGWQCLGPDPAFALRAALFLRARLGALGRSFDTRISVGIGSGRLPGAPDSQPRLRSGVRALGARARRACRTPAASPSPGRPPPGDAPLIRAVFALADEISRQLDAAAGAGVRRDAARSRAAAEPGGAGARRSASPSRRSPSISPAAATGRCRRRWRRWRAGMT